MKIFPRIIQSALLTTALTLIAYPTNEFPGFVVQQVYQNNLKNRDFDKEVVQIFDLERATIASRQGVSEDQKDATKPTQSKTDSSGCFGINHHSTQISYLRTLSYDEVLDLLSKIESNSFDERYSEDELNQINQFVSFLAMEGVTEDEKSEMEYAVASLFRKNDIQYAVFNPSIGYTIKPAIHIKGSQDFVLCKSWFKKQWDQTRSFVKKHRKAIIIGAIVVVTVTVVAAVAISSAAVSAAAGRAVSEVEDSTDTLSGSSTSTYERKDYFESKETLSNESLVSSLQTQLSEFKETIAQEQFDAVFESNGISMEENGRIIGSLFTHKTIDSLTNSFAQNPTFANELKNFEFNSQYPTPEWLQTYPDSSTIMLHPSTDLAFSTDYTISYEGNFGDLNALSYQVRGDLALNSQCYTQAVQDFGNAISLDPDNPILYLERGIANFELGNYEQSIADYNQFIERKTEPFSVTDFGLGFAKGVPKGAYDSGKGSLLLLSEFITHPVQTSKQIFESIGQLTTLIKNDEFGVVAESLSPELHQLVTQWNTLSPEIRGELAGYAIGKLGTDILSPGAVAKIASKSVNSAKELVAVYKNLQIAQKTLVLETTAGIGIPAKVAEIVEIGKNKLTFDEGFGLINKEIKFSGSNLTDTQKKIFFSSAAEKYNEHLTQLAHALSKHSGRKNTFWNKPTEPMNTWHVQALNQIEQICNAPGEFKKVFDASTGLTWIEKKLPNGQGIRLNQDYTFKGFLD